MQSLLHNRIIVAAGLLLGTTVLPANAQSSVTLYGVVDAGILYTSKTLDSNTGQNAGRQFSMMTGGMTPSLFGLKGIEDIGGGLKAMFTLESGIDATNGGFADSNGNLFGRQAWVGLASDYGTVKAGLQYSPFVLLLISTDARSVSYFGSGVPVYVGSVFVTGIFNANAISYSNPTIAGFQGRLDRIPDAMTTRRRTVEHVFGTFKHWMGYTHFLTRRFANVSTEMSLHVLAYNLRRVIAILGFAKTMKAMRLVGA